MPNHAQPDSIRTRDFNVEQWFAGPGEMRGRFRSFDWPATPLGPFEGWDAGLRTIASTILGSAFPNIVLWGRELIQLYNDGYREFMGAKHPSGFGIPTKECWPEAWEFNRPIYDRVFRGETVSYEDVLIPIVRYGALEDVYFTLSYSPIPRDDGSVGGVLVTLLETTAKVAARRLEAERERLLQQVQVERSRLGEVFRQAPAFLAVLRGAEHVFELANDSYYQLVGHRAIIGKPVVVALPEVRSQGFVELLDRVLTTGEPFRGEAIPVSLTRVPGEAPQQVYVDFVYQALVEADGSRSGVVAHGYDVTPQVLARRDAERLLADSEAARRAVDEANARLQASEERFRDVFEQAPMAVAVLTGPNHVYTLASPAYARSVGGRPLLGRAFRDAVPESGGQAVALLMDQVYETGEPITRREQLVPLDRDGDGIAEEYLFDISYQPLRDASGAVYAITSLSLDVTEQVRARKLQEEASRAIARASDQLGEVFSQAPVAIGVVEGPEHRFTLANPSYESVVGRTGLAGLTMLEALPELAGQPVLTALDDVFRSGTTFAAREQAVSLRRAENDGLDDALFDLVFHPLKTERGEVHAIVIVGVDVTEQVRSRREVERLLDDSERSRESLELANAQLEEQQLELELANQQLQDNAVELEAQAEALEEQTRAAEAANRAKSEFLATMSHELRTPLNAIGGYAELLLTGVRGELTPLQRADVERMMRSGAHLLGLINSILNFAKLDAGEVEFSVRPLLLAHIVDGLQDLIGPQIAAKSLHFQTDACEGSHRVLADPDKTRQILLNLLSNAVKFTAQGGAISIRCSVDGEWARIRVSDTGRGIAPEQLGRVFDPFVQVDRHLTPSAQQGVGLGLAISRDLAAGMGGALSVTSTVGEGSVFTLSLRRA